MKRFIAVLTVFSLLMPAATSAPQAAGAGFMMCVITPLHPLVINLNHAREKNIY